MASPAPSNSAQAEADKSQPSIFGRLRAYFFTGLAVTTPIVITIWATYWIVTLVDSWVKPLIPESYSPDTYLPFRVPGFGVIFALCAITLAGALAANLVGRTMIDLWDGLLNRTPIVRSIYKGSKQIVQTIFSQQGASFRNVCLVEWPRKGTWSLGFVTREIDGSEIGLEKGRPMYGIYVSTTPNPTSGYVFFVDVDEVVIINMSVEDSLKAVISMGLVFPDKPAKQMTDEAIAEAVARKPVVSRKKAAARPRRARKDKAEA